MKIVQTFFQTFWELGAEMAPYLLLGFLFAGILKMYFPTRFVKRHLGKNDFSSVLYAALIGVPLPLCSCGVVPTGVSLKSKGASNGATTSFLISTPQTGVDSILATGSLLGLPFAILRPVLAFISGLFGGVLTNRFMPMDNVENNSQTTDTTRDVEESFTPIQKLRGVFEYGFFTFMQDLSKSLFIGLLLAALISVVLPSDYIANHFDNWWLQMLIMLIISVPLYVCSTGSVPIVAALILNGLSPAAAFVFLMAGPATNIATITILFRSIGKKFTAIYLFSITFCAVVCAIIINYLLPQSWFSLKEMPISGCHMESSWFETISFVVLLILMTIGLLKTYNMIFKTKKTEPKANTQSLQIEGMTCNHCATSVKDCLYTFPEIKNIEIDLSSQTATFDDCKIDKDEISKRLKERGFKLK